jgi:hypothetical protein
MWPMNDRDTVLFLAIIVTMLVLALLVLGVR